MSLQLDYETHGSTDVVTITGELDIHTAPRLREELHQLIAERPKDVVVDLSGVPFLDSMGLGVLVGALKRARLSGGTVRLAGPDALATKVLRITGLVKVFSIYPDVQTALASPFDLPETGSERIETAS